MDCNWSAGGGCTYCEHNNYCILKIPLEENYDEIKNINSAIKLVSSDIDFYHNVDCIDDCYMSKSLEELREDKRFLKQELKELRRF